MRICIVYDCLFPWTVGGAERWYRNLAERLATDGHDVTYLTLRQWDAGDEPDLAGVDVRAVGPGMALYSGSGQRRILPPLVFGAGVFWHLLRRGRRYDVVHTGSFPFFSLLGAALLRPLQRFVLVVDWFEVWSAHYWAEYLGGLGGRVGHAVQRICVRLTQRAFVFSELHARRLREEGLRTEPVRLSGLYAGAPEPTGGDGTAAPQPLVVFAGRHIPEKHAPAVVPAVMRAREAVPGLRGVVFGDGPERPQVLSAITTEGADGIVHAPGFVDASEVDAALRSALCMVLPSSREGYGMVVVEAAARGTPSIVVAAEDNAAVELVEEDVNGTVAPSASPEDLAAAIERVHAGGELLRERTRAWFARNARRLSLEDSLDAVVASYDAREPSARS